ncbi:MAG: membrane protein insertase YidC, partial [Alphaproteobacteria bacterium]|nr:membrane protein insertase YidC [Alphaproteobacteria bacterium]
MNDQNNNRNLILAVVLSAAVLFGWQYFVSGRAMKAERERQAKIAKEQKHPTPAGPAGLPNVAGAPAHLTRDKALAAGGTRIKIDTPDVD